MIEGNGKPTETVAAPMVSVTMRADGQLSIDTNLPPEAQPLIVWLLEMGKFTVITQKAKSGPTIHPGTGMAGLMKRFRP